MAEPWFRCHARIYERRVVKRVSRALGITPIEAIGHMTCFWGGVSELVAKGQLLDGNLREIDDEQIENIAHWQGTAGQFATVVRDVHCDDVGRLNEFDEYFGVLAERRKKNRERMQTIRRSLAAPPEAVDDEIDARIASADTPRQGRIPITPQTGSLCAYCGRDAERWDYVIDMRAGGKHQKSNIVAACTTCVSERDHADITVFLDSRGIDVEMWSRAMSIDIDALREQFYRQKNTNAFVQRTKENVQSIKPNVQVHKSTTISALEAVQQKQEPKASNSDVVISTDRDADEPEDTRDYIGTLPPKLKRKLNRFIERFYTGIEHEDERVADVLSQINRGLSRRGTTLKGQTVWIEPASLSRALDDMPDKRSDLANPDAAIVVLLMKLHNGKANMDLDPTTGETHTESVSRGTRVLDAQPPIDPRVAEIVNGVARVAAKPFERAQRDSEVIARELGFDRPYRSILAHDVKNPRQSSATQTPSDQKDSDKQDDV